MPESPASPDPKPHVRFPYVAAMLCAACIGAVAWTWMRFSYCWDMTPGELDAMFADRQSKASCYVEVRGVHAGEFRQPAGWYREVYLRDLARPDAVVSVIFDGDEEPPKKEVYRGRASVQIMARQPDPHVIVVDPDASRLHGASIAGLVVGAMGVFVFTVALRHWLRERRAYRETVQ